MTLRLRSIPETCTNSLCIDERGHASLWDLGENIIKQLDLTSYCASQFGAMQIVYLGHSFPLGKISWRLLCPPWVSGWSSPPWGLRQWSARILSLPWDCPACESCGTVPPTKSWQSLRSPQSLSAGHQRVMWVALCFAERDTSIWQTALIHTYAIIFVEANELSRKAFRGSESYHELWIILQAIRHKMVRPAEKCLTRWASRPSWRVRVHEVLAFTVVIRVVLPCCRITSTDWLPYFATIFRTIHGIPASFISQRSSLAGH